MLALLAIACFPGAAQAVEATGPQYETDIPTVPQEESSPPKKKGGSNNGGTEESEAGKSNVPTGQGSGGNGPSSGGGGANNGQTSQGSDGGAGQAGDGSKTAAGGVSGGKPLATTYSPTSSESDSGGSSPLVPILMAVVVLAAISIGAFLYRQRRQGDPGSPVSPPKAS